MYLVKLFEVMVTEIWPNQLRLLMHFGNVFKQWT